MDEGSKPTRGTILHRLADAIRAQNWFAVVLEFLIVASGVLMGIQVSNWNEARNDQREIEGLLARIEPDMRANMVLAPAAARYFQSRIDFADKAEDFWINGGDDAELVKAAYLASSYALTGDQDRESYELKIGADTVSRIENDALRDAMTAMLAARADPVLALAYIETDFRKTVRRIYPIALAKRLHATCNNPNLRVAIDEIPSSLAAFSIDRCDVAIDPSLASRLASELRDRPTALGELREHRNRLAMVHDRIAGYGPVSRQVLEAMGKSVKPALSDKPTS